MLYHKCNMSPLEAHLTANFIEADVTRRWLRILELDDEPPTDDFFDLGGTSLKALQLLTEIEDNLNLSVPLMTFALQPTLRGLLNVLQVSAKPDSTSLVPMQTRGDRLPFFFVHAEFGHVFFARKLAEALGPDQPMYGIQSRGLDGREEPLTTLQGMAAHYLRVMRSVQARGPYRLGGYCMGALLALEMANQLQEGGEEVSHLAIFSTDASWMNVAGFGDQLKYHLREMGETGIGGALRYIWWRAVSRLYRVYSSAIRLLPPLYAKCGKALPARLRYVHIAELNYRAGWDFHPRPFQGTISYFQGATDKRRDPRPFWGNLATGGIEVSSVTGEMAGIFEPPHVDTLAAALRASLTRSARAQVAATHENAASSIA